MKYTVCISLIVLCLVMILRTIKKLREEYKNGSTLESLLVREFFVGPLGLYFLVGVVSFIVLFKESSAL
ncbi:MAG: hypothetical protein CME71_00625 [Halobacteriovorax sp.]|nr:hypothetical protein [Halobacteriovorax sp.]